MQTFYWYDYETTGVSAKVDRVMQFAGIRTDANLNIIDEHMYYCKPTYDCLPNVQALAITGITPQKCEAEGLIEHEFFKKINAQFSFPNTCIVGYNNIRFDDEFSRYGFFRNFIDPYAWHWQNNNYRWDIIDLVRMSYAFKKDSSLNWVYDDKGVPRFKLELLSVANDIEHTSAHDALADVRATIALAKIIKNKQPKLFDYACSLKDKKVVKSKIELFTPILHTSSKYAASSACTKMVTAVAYNPNYADRAIVFNLEQDPLILLENNIQDLQKLLFTKKDDLIKTGHSRLDMKDIVFNKSPMFVADIYKLDTQISKHLQIDVDICLKNLKFIQENQNKIQNIIKEIYLSTELKEAEEDVDHSLYDGFIDNDDKRVCQAIQKLKPHEIIKFQPSFKDIKLNSLFFNFKCRNYLKELSPSELYDWRSIVNKRIEGRYGYQSLADFKKNLKLYAQKMPEKKDLWGSLEKYANSMTA